MKSIIPSLAMATALALSGTATASAAPAHDDTNSRSLCSGSRTFYKASKSSKTFKQASGANSSVTGSRGTTLTISKSTTFTVGGSITASAGISAGAVIASVRADLGVTIQASRSGTTTTSGAWKVPSSYNVGRLKIGSYKYAGHVVKYLENRNCGLVTRGITSFNAPRNEWHFSHSKVS
jgi:hypothetical protein